MRGHGIAQAAHMQHATSSAQRAHARARCLHVVCMVSARDVCTHLYRYVCTGGIKHALRMHNALDGAEPSELGEERSHLVRVRVRVRVRVSPNPSKLGEELRHLNGDGSGALAARRPVGGGALHIFALRRIERHLGKGSQE